MCPTYRFIALSSAIAVSICSAIAAGPVSQHLGSPQMSTRALALSGLVGALIGGVGAAAIMVYTFRKASTKSRIYMRSATAWNLSGCGAVSAFIALIFGFLQIFPLSTTDDPSPEASLDPQIYFTGYAAAVASFLLCWLIVQVLFGRKLYREHPESVLDSTPTSDTI